MKQSEFNKNFVEYLTGVQAERDLLPLMRETSRLSAMRALEVYREDYQVRLTDALKNTFRVTHSILGDDEFFSLAMDYLAHFPSTFSDLEEYGDQFANFLQKHPLQADYPFLPQLAHFEWSFREIFHSREVLGLSALELQEAFTNEGTLLKLVPSARLLHYDFTIDKIYTMKDEDEVNFDYNGEQSVLLFKKNSLIKMHLLSKNQWTVVNFFHTPCSLMNCIKSAPATMTPEEIQELFRILGTEQILLKSL